ncbi:Blp family class II bacteriocin [Shewanella chilikensis]|uniref:Blp family class II bacteriocin n=1 Tax=Shewanella chilikensis TaxID=558541 RepID=UPI00399AA24D
MQELTMNEIEQVIGGYSRAELGAAIVGGALAGGLFGSVAGAGIGAGPGALAGGISGGIAYLGSQLYLQMMR